MSGIFSLFSTSPEKAEKRARKKAEKRAKKAAKRISTLKDLDKRSYRAHTSEQLDPEEIKEIYRLSDYKRAEVEMPGIQKRLAAAYPNSAPPERRRNRNLRRTRKRNTSLKSGLGQQDKYHDYTVSDTRPKDKDNNLIIPPPPPPTVSMLIDDFNNKKYIRGGKTRKRRRKRRRKTKRKGRRKTKKRRKRRKRKTRRKRVSGGGTKKCKKSTKKCKTKEAYKKCIQAVKAVKSAQEKAVKSAQECELQDSRPRDVERMGGQSDR